jgi:hypothetical protein
VVLLERCFDVDYRNRRFSGQSEVGNFGMRFGYPADTSVVQLSRRGVVMDERYVSENEPTVQVIRPNGGEQWSSIHKVEWEAGDRDGDRLIFNVLYSPDGGETWQSLASELTEPVLEVDAAQLPGSDRALMRVLASDGILTGADESDETFRVRRHAPQVRILTSPDGSGYEPGELILLTGSAYDLEDGPLMGDQMRWTISGLGTVGYGGEAAVRIDEPGEYEVTLQAQDSDQAVGEDTIIIFVGPTISVSPAYTTIGVSQTMTVALRVDDVVNLYGAQVELTFDADLIQVVDAYDFLPGVQIVEGDFPVPDTVIRNLVDNNRGRIEYAISLRGDKPGVSGSGNLASIVFHGAAEGLATVQFAGVVLSDPQSGLIPVRTEDGLIAVRTAAGDLTGNVILERRDSYAGAEVCVGAICTTTADDGLYTLSNVPPGAQTVEVTRMSYLRTSRPVNVPIGVLTLPDVTLLGGDVNQDGHIEQFDAMSMGLAWNSTPADPNWDERADVTDDGNVNILDMVAVQFNWDQMAPGPWPGALVAARSASRMRPLVGIDTATQVVVSPSSASLAGAGDTVDLDIRVEDVSDLYGGRVQITFDPTVIRVVDADPRPSMPGVQITAGDFLDLFNQFVLVNEADNTAGTIDFAVTQLHPATAVSGSGVLATVEFEAVGPGRSEVALVDVRLGDDTRPDPVEIPAGTMDGEVMVSVPIYLPVALKGS